MKSRALSGVICIALSLPALAGEGGHVFGWPFRDWKSMQPQGGTTTGAEVTLDAGPREAWTQVWAEGLEKKERDRRAIHAMAGSFRVSFDFLETLGFTPDYNPPKPYFSWATEHIEVIEDRGDFISLQHSLVMFFKVDGGKESGPHVMKHWRQDWTWEDAEIFSYVGSSSWKKEKSDSPDGRWSQAVFQVDDSPRYEVMGAWTHEGGLSTWRSDNAPRPLPRREFSVRKDYNILEGFHEITLSRNGWIHVQNNRKLHLGADGSRNYVGTEIGLNRYEAITKPQLAAAWRGHWEKTGAYWQAVREVWSEVMRERDRFTLREEVDGQKLFQAHFGRAAEIEKAEEIHAAADVTHARETIRRFLEPDE